VRVAEGVNEREFRPVCDEERTDLAAAFVT
jgi:hypothetical protein